MAQTIDLSSIEIRNVTLNGKKYELRQPIILSPYVNCYDAQLLIVDNYELGITLTGLNKEELLKDWESQINFLWNAYALVPEDNLAPDARRLRRYLLGLIFTDDYYCDCFTTKDSEFPTNSYGPQSLEDCCEVLRNVFINEHSGIKKVTISQSTDGCNPMLPKRKL